MKKTIAILGILGAACAFADTVQTANTFGLLRVDIGTATKEAIIAVPWLDANVNDGQAISVTNVIKTSELVAGDELYYYDLSSKKFKVWQLDSNRNWIELKEVGDAASNPTLTRGNAILLKRGDSSSSQYVYLYGQVAQSPSVEATMAFSSTAVALTLIAPPAAAEVNLNAYTWSNVQVGDTIILPDQTMLNWSGSAWGKISQTGFVKEYDTSKAKIPAGQGAWYRSAKGAKLAAKVTWTGMPSMGVNN